MGKTDANGGDMDDKSQRRRQRIEKKLQELDECEAEGNNKENAGTEPYFDLIEFADQYFNHFERGGDSTIMATLTRKSKPRDVIPKYEMIMFSKSSTIPNSHVHLYDPDNVHVACLMFRVRYFKA